MQSLLTAARSAVRFVVLVARRRVLMPRDRLGRMIAVVADRRFEPFRETALAGPAPAPEAAVLWVRFHLRGPGTRRWAHWLFQRVCIVTTPFWVGVPGFRVKLWMVDRTTGDYGGLYEWDSAEQAADYAASLAPLLRALSVPRSVEYTIVPRTGLARYLDELEQPAAA